MKKVFRILLIVLLAGLFVGTFVFLWNKTRPVKTVYGIVTPVRDTISQFVVATNRATKYSSSPRFRASSPPCTRRQATWCGRAT